MRYIRKSEEPECFTRWKKGGDDNWDPGWGDLDGRPIKQDVKLSLVCEQGYLCCYCEKRVDERDGHIEHLQARHARPELDLVYTNMLYSCKEAPKGQPTTCGHARRAEDPVPVSPLSENCESRFRYTEDGWMRPRDENDIDADETVRILNLNESTLRQWRAEVYQEVVEAFGDLSKEDFRRWMTRERQPDEHGRLGRFLGTKSHVAEEME